jgi:flagellar protein FlaG
MASVSSSHLILFIASMVVAAGVAGTFTRSASEVSAAIESKSLDESQELRTDLAVISDSGSRVYDVDGNGNITLLVKNLGSTPLPTRPEALDVLVDGRYRGAVTITVVDGPTWASGNVARLEIASPNLPAGDHRVKVAAGGDEEVFEFRT